MHEYIFNDFFKLILIYPAVNPGIRVKVQNKVVYRQNAVRTSQVQTSRAFTIFVEFMSDKVILDHKSHIWSILKIFIFCDFWRFSAKIDHM